MKKDLTVKELHDAKQNLEKEMSKLLADFEKKYDIKMRFSGIWRNEYAKEGEQYRVSLNIDL